MEWTGCHPKHVVWYAAGCSAGNLDRGRQREEKQSPGTTRLAGLSKGQEILSRNLDIWYSENHALILMQHKFKLYLYIPRRYRELDKSSNLAHFVLMLTNRNAADEPCWPIV